MKKLFCTLAAVLVFVLCAVPCFADSGYTITNYAVNATLNADNTVTQTETITVRSKGERIVAAGLEELRLRFPFHIAGIHSDNGSEFINHWSVSGFVDADLSCQLFEVSVS